MIRKGKRRQPTHHSRERTEKDDLQSRDIVYIMKGTDLVLSKSDLFRTFIQLDKHNCVISSVGKPK